MVRKRLCAIMLIFLLLCPRNSNSLGFLLIGYYCFVVGGTIIAALKIQENKRLRNLQNTVDRVDGKVTVVDEKVTVVDGKVTVVDGKVTVIDEKVTVVDGKATKIDQNVTALQGTVNNFDKKTDQNFVEVKSEVSATRVTLLNELSNKEKILSDVIKNTEQNIRQESQENYKNLDLRLEEIKKDIKTLATKEDLGDLKKSLKVIDDKLNNLKNEINNLKNEIVTNISESELRQNTYFKEQLEETRAKIRLDNEQERAVAKQFLERIERRQTESDNNNKSRLDKIETKIDRLDVMDSEMHNVIMGRKLVVAV